MAFLKSNVHSTSRYNNQWIVVDNKAFTPGQPVKQGTLWIAEQIPGYVEAADKSDVLKDTGYWASYNIVSYTFIFHLLSFFIMLALFPLYLQYFWFCSLLGKVWKHLFLYQVCSSSNF
jgi:hypothetical protein